MKLMILFAALFAANIAHAGADVAMPAAGVNRAAVVAWTSCAKNFLASDNPGMYSHELGGMLATLGTLDLKDDKVAKTLTPLKEAVEAGADALLVAQMPGGADPQLAEKTLQLRALAETPLGSFIWSSKRYRAEAMYRAYHERLSAEQKEQVAERMKPIAAALQVAAKPEIEATVDGSGFDPEIHKSGLSPAAVATMAKADSKFKELGIPVTRIRYNEESTSEGMGMYDAPSYNPASLTVSFADLDSYRRHSGTLPRKVGGLRIYHDAAQVSQAEEHARVESEQSLLTRARDHLLGLGLPITQLRAFEGDLTVWFENTAAYRNFRHLLPMKVFGARLNVSSKQVSESDAIDERARQDAIIAKARAYLAQEGYSVKDIKYNEGYESYGMSEFDGGSWTPPSLGVTFTNAQNLTRWNKRWFHRAAGHSVNATSAPEPGLGFPDPKDHYAAALAAAGAADAQFVAAAANLNNKSQNWGYTFFSAQGKEFINVVTDFLGHAALQSKRPARDILIHPIDITKAVALEAAYEAVKSATFSPTWVNLDRDLHGRVLYRFSSEDGKTQVLVDAATGKIAD